MILRPEHVLQALEDMEFTAIAAELEATMLKRPAENATS